MKSSTSYVPKRKNRSSAAGGRYATWVLPVLLCLLSLVLAGTCSLTYPARAAAAEIRVNAAEAIATVNPLVFGNSLIHSGDCMGYNRWVSSPRLYDEAKRQWNFYLPHISELGPTVLRYPGGLAANNFAWKPGIGPITTRDPDFSEKGVPQTFGTDEFLQYCEEIGAEAILVVNVSVAGERPGTVQDAADWVEYCNAPNNGSNPGGGVDWAAQRAANGHEEPYGVRFWELGNEDTYPSWDSYADRVNAYSAAMRAVDPAIQLGAIRTGGGLDTLYNREDWYRYQTLMLDKAGESFDFWIHHAHGPAVTGKVKGLAMCREGVSVGRNISVPQEGDYLFEVSAEGTCSQGICPRLVLQVDQATRGDWRLTASPVKMRSGVCHLTAGEHQIRVQAFSVGQGRRVVVSPAMDMLRQGGTVVSWIDLKQSREWYYALLGYWPVAREAYLAGEAYAGGKPVFYTEVNSVYQDETNPPFRSQATALQEMLSTGCIYHFLLNSGIPLATYWLLFQDRSGVGTLEGVAMDPGSQELGRFDPHRRPVFHLLKTYRHQVLDRLVTTEGVGIPEFSVGPQTGIYLGYAQKDFSVSLLQLLATVSEDRERLSLFVINLDPGQDSESEVLIEGLTVESKTAVTTISGPFPWATNEPEDCPAGDCVKAVEETLWLTPGQFTYTFPRHSVTSFVFYAAGADRQPPAAPRDLRGAAGEGVVLLNWNRVWDTDLQGYNIYRSRCPEGPYLHKLNAVPATGVQYYDWLADNSVMQSYAVKAVDLAGNESVFSNKVSLTPLAGLGVPGGPLPGGRGDVTPPSAPLLVETTKAVP